MRYLYLIILIAALAGCTNQELHTIGFVGPLSGPAASFGQDSLLAAELAINSSTTRIVAVDSQCTAEGGLKAMQQLMLDEHLVAVLTTCSSETLAMIPLAQEHQIPLVTFYAVHPDISGSGEYVLRSAYSDIDTIDQLATELEDFERVGIITEQTDYPIGLRNGVRSRLKDKIVSDEVFAQDSKQTRTQVLKLLDKDPQAIFVNANTDSTAIPIFDTISQQGFDGALYTNYLGSYQSISELSSASGAVYFSDPEVLQTARFESLFRQTYGKNITLMYPAASAYDAAGMIQEAIDHDTPVQIYLTSLKGYPGVVGNYTFDERGDAKGLVPSRKVVGSN